MTDYAAIGAAVIGTGFIGTVHTQALRRLGMTVRGVLGSSLERGRARAADIGVAHAYATLEDLLADDTVDVVHVTSPNQAHYSQVKAILAAGKHVICEKPLAMTSQESAEMAALAKASGKVAAVCYNIRFYPLNQQAHGMVKAGDIGDVRFLTGHYHQDWLAKDTDWNWRLQSEIGGALRSVGDIGTHWLDLTSFITGLKAASVFAELTTFLPERHKPVGRKNSLTWDIAGSAASIAWDNETPDHLFIGHRDAPNQTLMRDFGLMNPIGTAAATLPPGHVEGFADSFFSLFRAVYTDVAAGGRQDTSTWATFDDGHYEMQFCDAVLRSACEGRWVDLSEF